MHVPFPKIDITQIYLLNDLQTNYAHYRVSIIKPLMYPRSKAVLYHFKYFAALNIMKIINYYQKMLLKQYTMVCGIVG